MPHWVDYVVEVEVRVKVTCRNDDSHSLFAVTGSAPASSYLSDNIPTAVRTAVAQATKRAEPLAQAILRNEVERLGQ